MAIGLNQVKKTKNPKATQKQVVKAQSASPWESFDQLGPQARTVQANEALRNIGAKKKNNLVDFNFYKEKKEKATLSSVDIVGHVNLPCQSVGLIGFLKRLFLQ